jgi:uncharacterized protein
MPINFKDMKISDTHINKIKKLCEKYRVKTFSVFGSVLRNDFNPQSDIDFIVDFNEMDPLVYTDLYFQLKDSLERTLGRKIDLIELRGIKNKIFKNEIENSKVLIYGY